MRKYFFEYFKLKIEEKDYGSYKTEFENYAVPQKLSKNIFKNKI